MKEIKLNSEIKEILDDKNITDEKKIRRLRESICIIIFLDRDFSKGKVNNNLDEIQKKINIKEPFNKGELFFKSANLNITEEIFTEAVFELQENFCDTRLNDVKKIGERLYGNKVEEMKNIEGARQLNTNYKNTQKSKMKQQGPKNSKKNNQEEKKTKKNFLVVGGIIVLGIVSWFVLKK